MRLDHLADGRKLPSGRSAVVPRSAYSLVGYCQSQLGLVREAIEKYMALQFNPADACSQKLLEDAIGSLISSIDHNANHAETLEVQGIPPI